MAATSVPTSTGLSAAGEVGGRGHIGLLVLGSIASSLALGLLLVLAVFGGGEEAEITGSALLALGAGFMLLAVGSVRFTDQPQRWALAPGIAAAVAGLAILDVAARLGAVPVTRAVPVSDASLWAPALAASLQEPVGTLAPSPPRRANCEAIGSSS